MTTSTAEAGFSLHEDDTSYTVCDSWGGGRIFRKPVDPSDLREQVAEYVRECAELVADELVDEISDDEEPTE